MADCRPPPSLKFLSNFQKVECAREAVQDVSKAKSKDVFLIQVPSKFDVALLDGVTLDLKGTEDLAISCQNEVDQLLGARYRVTTENLQPECCPVLLLPSSAEDGSLRVGPPPCKQVRVYRSFDPPSVTLPDATPKTIKHIKGLKQRWKPFGWEDPPFTAVEQSLGKMDTVPTETPPKAKKTKKEKRQRKTKMK